MATPPPGSNARSGLGMILLLAVLVGLLGASLLAPAPPPSGVAILPSFSLPAAPWWLGPALVFGFLGLALLLLVGRGNRAIPLLGLAVLAVVVVIAEILRLLGGAVTPASPAVGNGTAAHNTTCMGANCTPPLLPSSAGGGPTWYEGAIVYGLLIAVAVAAVVLYPRVQQLVAPTSPAVPRPPQGPRELVEALERLRAETPTDDPRRRIIRAYGQLLDQVAKGLDGLEQRTPREIADGIVRRYGVRPSTARELTSLFEEARYSEGHPMPPDAVPRAERALAGAIAESSAARGPSA